MKMMILMAQALGALGCHALRGRVPMALTGNQSPAKKYMDESTTKYGYADMHDRSLCMGPDSVITTQKVTQFRMVSQMARHCRMQGFQLLSGIHASGSPMLAPFRWTLCWRRPQGTKKAVFDKAIAAMKVRGCNVVFTKRPQSHAMASEYVQRIEGISSVGKHWVMQKPGSASSV